jgi:DNA-binding IscR family transcriptional regulator
MTELCDFLSSCRIRNLWAKLRDVVAQTLDNMTLADLVSDTQEQEQSANNHFIALSDIHIMNQGHKVS